MPRLHPSPGVKAKKVPRLHLSPGVKAKKVPRLHLSPGVKAKKVTDAIARSSPNQTTLDPPPPLFIETTKNAKETVLCKMEVRPTIYERNGFFVHLIYNHQLYLPMDLEENIPPQHLVAKGSVRLIRLPDPSLLLFRFYISVFPHTH